jgi:hypothetical protein
MKCKIGDNMNPASPDVTMLRNILLGRNAGHYWAMGGVKFAPGYFLANQIYLGQTSAHNLPIQTIGGTTSNEPWVDENGENFDQKGDADDKDLCLAAFMRSSDKASDWLQLPELMGGPHQKFVHAVPPNAIYFSWGLSNVPLVTMVLDIENHALW